MEGSRPLIRIGKATFNSTFTQEQKDQLIDEHISSILKRASWKFSSIKYKYENLMKPVLQHIQSAQLGEILFEFIISNFLTHISHINFRNLKTMWVIGCELPNMEALAFIDAPNLQSLFLTKNSFTVFKSAHKVIFPSLKKLSFDINFIKEIDISRCKMNPNLKTLRLTSVHSVGMMSEIINFYAKMQQIKSDKQFGVRNFDRYLPEEIYGPIQQVKVIKCLLRKLNWNK